MGTLLCWSKERSRLVATEIKRWLSVVIPQTEPWMSAEDINKGHDWSRELHKTLSSVRSAIVCITEENVHSPWLYYECGQVSARSSTNRICPFLLVGDASLVADGPLHRFQATVFKKQDLYQLCESLIAEVSANGEAATGWVGRFEQEWAEFSGTLTRLRDMDFGLPAKGVIRVVTESELVAGRDLSPEVMVCGMGADQHGMLMTTSTNSGDDFWANGVNLNAERSARSTAKWRAALKVALRTGLIQSQGQRGEMYVLTQMGFEVYDLLSGEPAGA